MIVFIRYNVVIGKRMGFGHFLDGNNEENSSGRYRCTWPSAGSRLNPRDPEEGRASERAQDPVCAVSRIYGRLDIKTQNVIYERSCAQLPATRRRARAVYQSCFAREGENKAYRGSHVPSE